MVVVNNDIVNKKQASGFQKFDLRTACFNA